VVAEVEHAIIENTFRLGDRQAGSLMTPRPDLPWIDVDCDARELLGRPGQTPRMPLLVCDGEVDRVLGVAHAEHLLFRCLAGEPFDLRAALRRPLFVPATMPALHLLEEFRRTRERVAVVLDEYGGLQGLVTDGDLLEALVGELPEPGDPDQPEIQRRLDGSWLVDGGVAMEELEGALDLDARPEDERRDFRTVAGFVMAHLGRIATVGDRVEADGLRYQVVEMEGRPVARVRIRTPAR
jgi:putative hemolysin